MRKGFAAILIVCFVAAAIAIAGVIGYSKFKDKLIFTAKTTQQSFPQESLDALICDVNTDGKCNVADLDLLKQALGTSRGQQGYIPLADLDADGVVNDIDKQILLKLLDQNQADETASWKTYINEELEYSLKYPKELSLQDENNVIILNNYNEIGFGRPNEVPFRGNEIEDIFIGIRISTEIIDQEITLEEYLAEKYPVNNYGIPSYQNQKDKFKGITIGQKLALLSEKGMQFENDQRTAWVKKDSNIYIFIAFGSGETGTGPSEIAAKTFDQILSTFKFLD